jgi:hypothetical protein
LAKAEGGTDADLDVDETPTDDAGDDPFAELPFDPKRLLNGDRVIVDFGEIDSYDFDGERVATLSHLDLDPPLRGPRFKAVVPFKSEDRNGGWECGGPLSAIRPAGSSNVRRTTD